MPTAEQLNHLDVTEGDGAAVTSEDDGSTTTSWPDGSQRIDLADGSVMVSFPDGSVLNMYPDGTKTLNDVNGVELDPTTGAALGGSPSADSPPAFGADAIIKFLDGDEELADANEAKELFDAFTEALEGETNPVDWVAAWFKMVLAVVKALETSERGCYVRGWCYGVLYGSQGMGTPPEPNFANNLLGPDQDSLNKQGWNDGVAAAMAQLAAPKEGVELRNRTLLRIARNRGDVAATLREMYIVACDSNDDKALRDAYQDILGWPDPTGA